MLNLPKFVLIRDFMRSCMQNICLLQFRNQSWMDQIILFYGLVKTIGTALQSLYDTEQFCPKSDTISYAHIAIPVNNTFPKLYVKESKLFLKKTIEKTSTKKNCNIFSFNMLFLEDIFFQLTIE